MVTPEGERQRETEGERMKQTEATHTAHKDKKDERGIDRETRTRDVEAERTLRLGAHTKR